MRWTATIVFGYFVCFSMAANSKDNWTLNNDTVDLGIGIHHGDDHNGVGALMPLLERLVNILDISAENTRIAIVDYRAEPFRFELQLHDGGDKSKVLDAIKRIEDDTRPTVTPTTWDTVSAARHVHEELTATGRIDVPKLVFLFIANSSSTAAFNGGENSREEFLRDNYVTPIAKQPGLQSVSAVFMDRFKDVDGHDFILLAGFAYENADSKGSATSRMIVNSTNFAVAAALVKGTMRYNLGLCRYNRSITCRGDCVVADVTYKLAYERFSITLDPSRWERVKHYCFKNGSTTTCQDSNCEASPSSKRLVSTAKPASTAEGDFYYNDDPYVVKLRRALSGLGIAFGIVAVADVVLYVNLWKAWNEKKIQDKAAERKGMSMSTSKAPEWTIQLPPKMTVTPDDQLLKDYLKRSDKTTRSSRRSKKSQRSNKSLAKTTKMEATAAEPEVVKVEPAKTEAKAATTAKVEPMKAEPAKAEPMKMEAKLAKAEPAKTEPMKAEPTKIASKLGKAEPTKVEPKMMKAEAKTAMKTELKTLKTEAKTLKK